MDTYSSLNIISWIEALDGEYDHQSDKNTLLQVLRKLISFDEKRISAKIAAKYKANNPLPPPEVTASYHQIKQEESQKNEAYDVQATIMVEKDKQEDEETFLDSVVEPEEVRTIHHYFF